MAKVVYVTTRRLECTGCLAAFDERLEEGATRGAKIRRFAERHGRCPEGPFTMLHVNEEERACLTTDSP